MTRRLLFVFLLASVIALAASAYADDDGYVRIARLSYIEGHVNFQHSEDVDWSAASINLVLEPGDRIYTGQDGKAEIQFDDGSVCRLAESTDIEILSLNEDLIQIRMLLGLATLNAAGDADFEINTPAAAFNIVRKGVYRFDVVENGNTDAIVRKGDMEAASNSFSQRVKSGELLHVRASGDGTPSLSQYSRRDQWDEWNDRRNADLNAYTSRTYLPSTVYIGASDLDRHGRWVEVESYGTAWVPRAVSAHWSPYSAGRWCYRPFHGWTWISYEPWGWLPYHYGRWHQSASFGWVWIPGSAVSFHFWSPGLVAFYNGPGWISWCPLGPGDFYEAKNYYYNRRLYRHLLEDMRRQDARRPGDLLNLQARGAFHTVQIDHFRDGIFGDRDARPILRNIDQPWRQGTLVRERLDIKPTSISYKAAPDRPAPPPRTISSLPVVVRSNPAITPGTRERFTRITNPNIPPIQSRKMLSGNEPASTDAGSGSATGNRIFRNLPQERSVPGARTLPGSNANPPSSRQMNTPPPDTLIHDQPFTPRPRSSSASSPAPQEPSAPAPQVRRAPQARPAEQAPSAPSEPVIRPRMQDRVQKGQTEAQPNAGSQQVTPRPGGKTIEYVPGNRGGSDATAPSEKKTEKTPPSSKSKKEPSRGSSPNGGKDNSGSDAGGHPPQR